MYPYSCVCARTRTHPCAHFHAQRSLIGHYKTLILINYIITSGCAAQISNICSSWGKALRERRLMTEAEASNKVSWHKDGMNLDSRHSSIILQHWLREINQVLKSEILWHIEQTNFWELWKVWGCVQEQHISFSATLQLAVLLSLFLLVWKYRDRKRWALFYSYMGDQGRLSALCYFVVREVWDATVFPSYISPSGILPNWAGRKEPKELFCHHWHRSG